VAAGTPAGPGPRGYNSTFVPYGVRCIAFGIIMCYVLQT
jgi:hypothetical protein